MKHLRYKYASGGQRSEVTSLRSDLCMSVVSLHITVVALTHAEAQS